MNDSAFEKMNSFDDAFEHALSELFETKITKEDLAKYFGPSALGIYLKERLLQYENENREAGCSA